VTSNNALHTPRPPSIGDGGPLPPTCQFCLADGRYTPVAWHLPERERCPVCGAAYTGPRRDAEYQALLTAGLVATGS
jgi:hypothetical protein